MKGATLISIHPSGQVVWGREAPKGALVIARAERYRDARAIVTTRARHAYDGKRYLCPGVPEAESDAEAMRAALGWRDWICSGHQAGVAAIDPPYIAGETAGEVA